MCQLSSKPGQAKSELSLFLGDVNINERKIAGSNQANCNQDLPK